MDPVKEVRGILILVLAIVLLLSVWWIKHRLDKADAAIQTNAAMADRIDKLDKRVSDYDTAMQDRQTNATEARDFGSQQQALHREIRNESPPVRSWDDAVIPGELRARSSAARRQRTEAGCASVTVYRGGTDQGTGGCRKEQ